MHCGNVVAPSQRAADVGTGLIAFFFISGFSLLLIRAT